MQQFLAHGTHHDLRVHFNSLLNLNVYLYLYHRYCKSGYSHSRNREFVILSTCPRRISYNANPGNAVHP